MIETELEKEEKITIFHRKYQREDIYDAWMVLAATNDPELNNGIYSVAKCLGAIRENVIFIFRE